MHPIKAYLDTPCYGMLQAFELTCIALGVILDRADLYMSDHDRVRALHRTTSMDLGGIAAVRYRQQGTEVSTRKWTGILCTEGPLPQHCTSTQTVVSVEP